MIVLSDALVRWLNIWKHFALFAVMYLIFVFAETLPRSTIKLIMDFRWNQCPFSFKTERNGETMLEMSATFWR